MQLKVDEERKKAEGFHEDLTKERLAVSGAVVKLTHELLQLGRQLASSQERANKLEEIVEALRFVTVITS